ncbi:helix-turn-helix transcriptional regulator [Flagellimonas meishanensis]|uniref:helix-turn-helix transcriptional regulator n=1 Tax=Flagellimonas meishanensis TaxID=2873264 RepID=UPI0028BE4C12|nr:helix-turn-helix transcriptional regulator [[Muricauda] meishanensis]
MSQQQPDDGLSSKELRKFRYFEQRLNDASLSQNEKEAQLKDYARDSIQILKVKLIAIKVLDERNLLRRDIQENPEFYSAFLQKLKDSDIPPNEYLFLEEKMAHLNLPILQRKLSWSTGFNVGLLVLIFLFIGLAIWYWRSQHKSGTVTLSKQEALVKNLILQGKSNKEIANELFISLSTVKSHITNIYTKLQVSGRQELLQNSTGTST